MRLIGQALGWLALLALAGCADTRENAFSSMSTSQAQDMVSRGWIPAVLPSTATDVQVRSNIDTNMVRGTARVPEPDLGALRAALRPLADDAVPPFWTRGSVTPPWWPADLLPPSRASELRRRGWEVFSVPDQAATYMAIHPSEGKVYFWSESS